MTSRRFKFACRSTKLKGRLNEMDIPERLTHCYACTLRVETTTGAASSFVMTYKGSQWLVTARHVVYEVKTQTEKPFDVLDQHGVKHPNSELKMLDMTNPFADVTVFRLWIEKVNSGPPLEQYGADEVHATQPVYLLGFPDLGHREFYGLAYSSPTTPFIKHAIVSGEAKHGGMGIKVWLLDGVAHHGFSGGPVIIREPESEGYRVLGVTSGYVPANVRIIPGKLPADPVQVGAPRSSPDDSFSETNSGLALCFGVRHAVADIDAYLSSQPSE
jgi:Trypsin-like peptidase domain